MKALLMGVALLLAAPATAETQFPQLTGRVVDLVDEIPADREARLTADLKAFEAKTGHQIVVLTVPTLQGDTIEDYGYKLGRTWAIGRKGLDDGIILIHSTGDRKVRLEVGYGLEPIVTDAESSQIINGTIIPAFKEGRFADGIIEGAAETMKIAAITPEQKAENERRLAAQHARDMQRAKDFLGNLLAFLFGAGVIGGAGFGLWRFATRKERARRRAEEAERQRLAAEAAERRRQELAAARAQEAERQRLAAEEERRRRERMLAAMSPADRAAFLAREEAERAAAAEAARKRREKEEQEEAERRKQEAQRRRSDDSGSFGGGYGGSYGGSSGGGGDTFSGGGGSFGGGGASGGY